MKTVKLAALSTMTLMAISCLGTAAGQGTVDLPSGHQTKEYQMLGTPPTDIEPVINPDGNPGGVLPGPNLVVPEPATSVLLLLGAGGLAAAALRRRIKR